MINAKVLKSKDGTYRSFVCSGHAGFAKSGNDIICAAVSMLVINTINSIEVLTEEKAEVEQSEKTGNIKITFRNAPCKEVVLLMDSMILGLNEIEKKHNSKYLKLKFEEV